MFVGVQSSSEDDNLDGKPDVFTLRVSCPLRSGERAHRIVVLSSLSVSLTVRVRMYASDQWTHRRQHAHCCLFL